MTEAEALEALADALAEKFRRYMALGTPPCMTGVGRAIGRAHRQQRPFGRGPGVAAYIGWHDDPSLRALLESLERRGMCSGSGLARFTCPFMENRQ